MIRLLFLLLPFIGQAQITSYTAAQTGSGHAEVYWPTSATHADIFLPGAGERSTPSQLYAYNSPINQVKNGSRPQHGVAAFSPGAYSFVSASNASFLKVVKFIKWLKALHPELQTISLTGLSYGAADWYNYIKFSSDADFNLVKVYSAVLMSITSESQCPDKTKLCGTDTRFKDIKLWALDGRNDSHHDKQYRYTKVMIDAGYPAKWESIPNTGHCCWDVQYSRKEVMDWLAAPVTAPGLTINAGADTTISFPQDNFPIRVTGVPSGAEVRATIREGGGVLEGMILKNLYKTKTTVQVDVFYQGQRYTDTVVITAVYDPEAVFKRFKLGDLNMVILNDGRIMQEF